MPIISNFGGIIPRAAWHDLPLTNATIAHNVKLRNGKLEPWRERLAVGASVTDAVCVWYHGCCYYTFDKCVDMAEYVTDYDRLYFTGRQDYPEVAKIGTACALDYYRLGVPKPASVLQASGTSSDGRNCAERSYVYTYVNQFGEEGAPSRPSNPITVADGTAVRLSNFVVPDSVYGVTQINIYRTATAWSDGSEKVQTVQTDYLLVATVAIGTPAYTDSVLEKNLGSALTTEYNREPPENLREIRYLRGTGVLTGVTTNKVHFSQPYQPGNWPSEYDLTLPYNIVNIQTLGNKLFVSTDSYPFVIDGAPNCEAHQCRAVNEVFTPLPDISCGHVNSSVATPFGMVYSSKDGLVLVSPDAKFQVITSAWFSTDDWVKIRPDTARLAYWRGYIVCVTDLIAFMLEIDAGVYNDSKISHLVTISDAPVALTTTQSGELIMLEGNILWQWNAGNTYREYKWTSRELNFGGTSTPLACKVKTDGIQLLLIDMDGLHLYERFVPDEKPVRLKRLGRQRSWRLSFVGTGTVEYAALGMLLNTLEGNTQNGTAI